MATVEVRSVVKRFGSVQVLHGIDATSRTAPLSCCSGHRVAASPLCCG